MVELRRRGHDRHARSRRARKAPEVQPAHREHRGDPEVIDLTRAVRALQVDGHIILRDDLAQLSSYQTRRLKRFGDYTLSLSAPEPFDSELLVPFALDEQAEIVVAESYALFAIFRRMSA